MNWILLIIVIASAIMLLCFTIRLIKGAYRIFIAILNKVISLLINLAIIVSWPIRKLVRLFNK